MIKSETLAGSVLRCRGGVRPDTQKLLTHSLYDCSELEYVSELSSSFPLNTLYNKTFDYFEEGTVSGGVMVVFLR